MLDRNNSLIYDTAIPPVELWRAVDVVPQLRQYCVVGTKRCYGVQLCFEDEGEEKTNSIRYRVDVRRIADTDSGQCRFQLQRQEAVYINDQEPDRLADELAYKAGQVFYPLNLIVAADGGFLQIDNHADILKRWPSAPHQLQGYYVGKLVEDYLCQMDNHLQSFDYVNQSFAHHDWFIQSFFKPIYGDYGDRYERESTYRFPVLESYVYPGYTVKESLHPYVNDFGAYVVQHHGHIGADEAWISNDYSAQGEYHAYLLLHPRFRHILSLVSALSYKPNGLPAKAVTIKVFLLQDRPLDCDFQEPKHNLYMSEVPNRGAERKESIWKKLFN